MSDLAFFIDFAAACLTNSDVVAKVGVSCHRFDCPTMKATDV